MMEVNWGGLGKKMSRFLSGQRSRDSFRCPVAAAFVLGTSCQRDATAPCHGLAQPSLASQELLPRTWRRVRRHRPAPAWHRASSQLTHQVGLKPLVSPTHGSITAAEGLLPFIFHGYRL